MLRNQDISAVCVPCLFSYTVQSPNSHDDVAKGGGAHHEQHTEFPKGDPPDMSVGTHIRVLHQFQLISIKKKIPDWQKN